MKKSVKIALIVSIVICGVFGILSIIFSRIGSIGAFITAIVFVILGAITLLMVPLITWSTQRNKELERPRKRIFPVLFAIFLSIGICLSLVGIIYIAAFTFDSRLFTGIGFLSGGLVSIAISIVFRVYHKKSLLKEEV